MINIYIRNTTSVIFIMVGLFFNPIAFAGNNASLSTMAVITPKPCDFSIDQSQFNFSDISMEKPDYNGDLNVHKYFNMTASDGCERAYLTTESSRYSGENNTIALPSSQQEDEIGLGVAIYLTRSSDYLNPPKTDMSFDGSSHFEFVAPSVFHYEGNLSVVPINQQTMLHGPNAGQIKTNIMFTVHYS